jgi:inosine-uridine nucleoside N-ribohydrolase
MKKRTLLCVFLIFVWVCSAARAIAEPKKIILDSDMRPGFDDGAVLALLAGWTRKTAEASAGGPALPSGFNEIELLGVTVVAGNETEPRGFAHGVRQLEIMEGHLIGKGIPIYEGARYGLRGGRLDKKVMEAETRITGAIRYPGYFGWVTNPAYAGVPDRDPMQPWKDFYKSADPNGAGYGRFGLTEPTYTMAYYPKQRDGTEARADASGIDNAVDFIIHAINSNPPHTVSILAIGPLTNVALALRKDPGIAERAKEIVYMGGSFYMKGNSSDVAEFNWWADPEAAKMVVRTAWGNKDSQEFKDYGNQVVSGLEAAVYLKRLPTTQSSVSIADIYPGNSENTEAEEDWFAQSQWFYDDLVSQCRFYRRLPNNSGAYDVIAAAWLIDPTVITTWYSSTSENPVTSNTAMTGLWIDVEADYTSNYGRSTAYAPAAPTAASPDPAPRGPIGTQKAALQANSDEIKFWNKIVAPAFIDPAKTIPTPYAP